MLFITLELIDLKNFTRILKFVAFVLFLSNCYRALLWTGAISFLEKYKLFYFFFSFILLYFDFFIKL